MIPVVRTYRTNPAYIRNMYNDIYCGGKMETHNEKVNIIEKENNFQLDIIAPGYSKEEVKITIEKNELTIASVEQNKENNEAPKEKHIRREFIKEAFSRTFKLPENVEADKIEASHKNGIISVSLPKKAKIEVPVQEIEVK